MCKVGLPLVSSVTSRDLREVYVSECMLFTLPQMSYLIQKTTGKLLGLVLAHHQVNN
jgi:hypothetical protein